MKYKNYRYKVEYNTPSSFKKEAKFEVYDDLESFLGSIVLVISTAVVYKKIKGHWEEMRKIESRIVYP